MRLWTLHNHSIGLAVIICDSICEKGPLGGNVNIWVRVKTRAKSVIRI